MGIDDDGSACIIKTKGNYDCHTILRGDKYGPNYRIHNVNQVKKILENKKLVPRIMIDCSHGNSNKDFYNQPLVFENVIQQIHEGNNNIIGLMLESNINQGSQSLTELGKNNLKRGVSITDGCINIQNTESIIMNAYKLL